MENFKMKDFINDITTDLEALNNSSLTGDKNWTNAIKKAIIKVAKKYDLIVNCKLNGEEDEYIENKEWLYDIIVYSHKNGIFDEVYLVGESEWNSYLEEIEDDFLKLIFARAEIRLMVFQVSNDIYNEYKNRLIEIIKKSNSCIKGDKYLFAIYNTSTEKFKVEQYVKY